MHKKHIVVSGGSKGLGLSIVNLLIDRGAEVTCLSRTLSIELKESISKSKGALTHIYYDINDYSKSFHLVHDIDRNKPIDGLVNNAGIAKEGLFVLSPNQDLEQVINTNLIGTFALTREVSKRMLTRASGSIVNITSVCANTAFSGLSAYSASKAAIEAWTRTAARELGKASIRINAVAPGFIETDMSHSLDESARLSIIRRTPIGRFVLAQEVAEVVAFMISSASQGITGAVIPVDGGCTL